MLYRGRLLVARALREIWQTGNRLERVITDNDSARSDSMLTFRRQTPITRLAQFAEQRSKNSQLALGYQGVRTI